MDSIDKRLDEIYNKVDDLLLAGKFEEVDKLLSYIDVRNTNIDILLGWLTITLAARSKLKNRANFFFQCKTKIVFDDRNSSTLLQGLE